MGPMWTRVRRVVGRPWELARASTPARTRSGSDGPFGPFGLVSRAGRTVLGLCLLVVGAGCGADREAADGRPNVLVIVLDTTRADYFSSYGYPRATTPHLDALAAEGVRYASAFTTDFWTLPSHASLFTGRYPSEVGATSETNHLPAGALTLAERLAAAGYRTGATVSNPWISVERGFAQGFQEFTEMWRKENQPSPEATQVESEQAAVHVINGWLQRAAADARPFFHFVNFNIVHMPYFPAPEMGARFLRGMGTKERTFELSRIHGMWPHYAGLITLDATDYEIMRDLYCADLAHADEYVGQVIEALRMTGELDHTLVIVTSDHGENLGERGMIDHMLSMHDTVLHVPLLVRYPARFPAGTVREDLVSLVDLLPTILEVCGVEDSEERWSLEAASLAGAQWVPRELIYAENERPINGIELLRAEAPGVDTGPIERRWRAIRNDTHKLIWTIGNPEAGIVDQFELFDLREDPVELHDVGAERPEIRNALVARLREYMETRAPAAEVATEFRSQDAEALERLRSLGYIR